MPIVINYKDDAAWHELRLQDITSTDSPALFNLSPYLSEFELWYRKSDKTLVEFPDNERMRWGRRLESSIAKGIAEDEGMKVRALNCYYRHTKESRMGCTCDFEIVSHDEGPGILEIKNVDYLVYRDQWTEDEAPTHIEIQLQHQLEVLDREWGYIVALVGGNRLYKIKRMRDREMGQSIREAVSAFWLSIANGQEPEPNFDNDADFIISMHQKCGGKFKKDDSFENEFIAYTEAREAVKTAEAHQEGLKASILIQVGDEYAKIEAGEYRLSCGLTKGSAGRLVTPEMVGTHINPRKGFRLFRINKIGEKKDVEKDVATNETEIPTF